jgi:hypothetical protein
MFITLSTIFVPIKTGLTLSLALEYIRLTAGTEPPLAWCMPLEVRPLEGEHDCRLGLPLELGSMEEDRELGSPGLPLVADSGLSGTDVLKFGGASSEKPGISEGFHGLDFTIGEVPRDGTGFLDVIGAGFETEEADLVGGADTLGALDGVDGRRVGVAALDVDLDGGKVGLAVGVEDLAVDLDGVEDLAGAVGLAAGAVVLVAGTEGLVAETEGLVAETEGLVEGKVALDVGVEDLEGLDADVNVGRPVGVAGLDPGPPDDGGLRGPLEVFNPGEETACLDTKFVLVVGSSCVFANCNNN